MDVETRYLLTALVTGFALAFVIDVVVSRSRRTGALSIAAVVIAGALLRGTFRWLGEPQGAHSTNPQLSRALDWVAHVGTNGVIWAMPVLLGLAVTVAMLRTRVRRVFRIATAGGAVFAGFLLGFVLYLSIVLAIYHDGP